MPILLFFFFFGSCFIRYCYNISRACLFDCSVFLWITNALTHRIDGSNSFQCTTHTWVRMWSVEMSISCTDRKYTLTCGTRCSHVSTDRIQTMRSLFESTKILFENAPRQFDVVSFVRTTKFRSLPFFLFFRYISRPSIPLLESVFHLHWFWPISHIAFYLIRHCCGLWCNCSQWQWRYVKRAAKRKHYCKSSRFGFSFNLKNRIDSIPPPRAHSIHRQANTHALVHTKSV